MSELANKRHEHFVHNLIDGMSQYDAYLDVYPNARKWKRNSIDTAAYKLSSKAEISHRFSELQQEAIDAKIMDRNERLITLTTIARDTSQIAKARMQAIDLLNKMCGDYVKRIEANVTTDTTEIAEKVKSILAGDGS